MFEGVKGVRKKEVMGGNPAAPVYIALSSCMDCMF